LSWRHAFGDTTPQNQMSFAGGGNAFSVSGTPIAQNTAMVEAGFDLGVSERAIVNLSYDGEISRHSQQHGFNARLQVTF